MSKRHYLANVDLVHSDETDTILLGHRIGTFETEFFKGDVTASGETLRVHVDGISGYVDIKIKDAVNRAVNILRGIKPTPDEVTVPRQYSVHHDES